MAEFKIKRSDLATLKGRVVIITGIIHFSPFQSAAIDTPLQVARLESD